MASSHAVNHIRPSASAAARIAPPNYTAPRCTATVFWVPGPATESRDGRLSIPNHKLILTIFSIS